MMKAWFVVLILVLSTALSIMASDLPKDLLSTTLKPFYPIYNKANKCYGVWADNGVYDGMKTYQSGYCVRVVSQKTVQTKRGKRLYVMTAGDIAFDKDGIQTSGGHVNSGLVGMFVLKPAGKAWQVESKNATMNVGSSGIGTAQWKLVKLAPDEWGFVGEHGDGHYGISGSRTVILTPDGKGGVLENWIGASMTNGSDRCEEAKSKDCDDVEATMTVDSSKVVNGFYPLSFSVTGMINGKKYHKKSYQIPYKKGKGYVAPNDYPLNNIEY